MTTTHPTTGRTYRVGPTMEQLCWMLWMRGGTAPSRASLYTRIPGYHGSNQHGDAVMRRCERAGLIQRHPDQGTGNAIPVSLTPTGEEVAKA